jgi:hypothetical protein
MQYCARQIVGAEGRGKMVLMDTRDPVNYLSWTSNASKKSDERERRNKKEVEGNVFSQYEGKERA